MADEKNENLDIQITIEEELEQVNPETNGEENEGIGNNLEDLSHVNDNTTNGSQYDNDSSDNDSVNNYQSDNKQDDNDQDDDQDDDDQDNDQDDDDQDNDQDDDDQDDDQDDDDQDDDQDDDDQDNDQDDDKKDDDKQDDKQDDDKKDDDKKDDDKKDDDKKDDDKKDDDKKDDDKKDSDNGDKKGKDNDVDKKSEGDKGQGKKLDSNGPQKGGEEAAKAKDTADKAKKAKDTADNAKKAQEVAEKAKNIKDTADNIKNVAEVAGTATKIGSGPVGWVLLALSLLKKIIQWIKKHPYESMSIGIVSEFISMLPIILLVIIIFAFIFALWAWLSGAAEFFVDTGYKILDNITFGIFDFGTVQDVNKYMSLLDKEDDDFSEGEDNIMQTRDMMFDMLDMTEDYYETFYDINHEEVIDMQVIRMPINLQTLDNKTKAWIGASQSIKNKYLASNVYKISNDVIEKFYYGELYIKVDGKYKVATQLNNDEEYYTIAKYTYREDGNQIQKIDIRKEDEKYYIDLNNDNSYTKGELVSKIYSVPDDLAKNLYDGTLYNYADRKERKDFSPVDKVVRNKTYYYVTDEVEYKHKGDTINVDDIVSYFDILKEYSVEGVSLATLTAQETGYGFTTNDFKKDSKNFYEYTESEREDATRSFLRLRLKTYVAAENKFWKANGDGDVNASDITATFSSTLIGAGAGAAVGSILPGFGNVIGAVVGGVGGSITGMADMVNKLFFDNNNIKIDGYRIIEPTVYEARLTFANQNGMWELYPLASEGVSVDPFIETNLLNGAAKKLLKEIPVIGEWIKRAEKKENEKVIYREELFSFSLRTAKVDDYDVYDKGGYFISVDDSSSYSQSFVPANSYPRIRYYEEGSYLKYHKQVKRTETYSYSYTDSNGNRKTRKGTRTVIDNYYDYVYKNGKKIDVISSDQGSGSLGYTIQDVNERIMEGNYDKDTGEYGSGGSLISIGFEMKLKKKAGLTIDQIIDKSVGTTNEHEAQKIIYEKYEDGKELNMEDDDIKDAQSEIDDLLGEGAVDLADINSVNKLLKNTDIKVLDERELVKPYGIPSAFSYFVPLEESTRNIPFLIALAQEMRDTVILLSPLTSDSSVMKNEEWQYQISKETYSSNPVKPSNPGLFVGGFDANSGSIYVRAFGITILDVYPKELRKYDLTLKRVPVREVIYADLWDRTIVNEFIQVISETGDLENFDNVQNTVDYTKKVEHILANQFIDYKETPYDLIKAYNVSPSDVGIYEEVTGRPFLSQDVYDKIMTDNALKAEWKDALGAKDLLKPVNSTIVVAAGNCGLKYSGSGDVMAVKNGEVIEVLENEIFDKNALYSRYVIIYHEEDKTFSMYAMLDNINVSKGQKVAIGEKIGTYDSDMYFEYRQGGGEFKEFWAASSISVADVLSKELEEADGESTPEGSY